MGRGNRNKNVTTKGRSKEVDDSYWAAKDISDTARENVQAGLDNYSNFEAIDLNEFARSKRDQATNERSRKKGLRENQEQAREAYYRRQMKEKRRENEMRKAKKEMDSIGTLGGQNPYGDSAIWNNETRSWEPNTKVNNLAQWNDAKAKSDIEGTNLFGQGQGIDFRPGSSARGTINDEFQSANTDFKKLYEQLLELQNSKK